MTTQDSVNLFLDLLRKESKKLCNLLELHKEKDDSENTPLILQELIDDYLSKFEKLRASRLAENKPNLTNSMSDPTELLIASVQDELSIGVNEVKGTKPRGHISWHEYFMSVAQLAARRSKDPATQVGACIVNEQNKIVATGYNGMPNGVHDNEVPWSKEGPYLETKYAYVVHAELNAILNCVLTDQKGCRVYVSLFPCNECAKAIIQSGIRHVIFLSDKHKDRDSTKAAKIMFKMARVRCEQYSNLLA